MSDYLGNLAARSLEPVQAVRPRLASRFEPLAPWGRSLGEERMAQDALSLETTVEELATAPARTSPPAEPSRRTMPLMPLMPLMPPMALTALTAPAEPMEEPPATQRRRARRHAGVEEAEAVVEPRRPETLRPQRPTAALEVALPSQLAAGQRGVLPREASPPGPLSLEERGMGVRPQVVEAGLPQRRTVLEPTPRWELSHRVRGPGGEAARADRPDSRDRRNVEERSPAAVLQPKLTVVEREPFPARRETPTPTIQVTIGRLEVRATPAPKAPVWERPAAPAALSLEDYLKQRSRGEGR